MPPAASSKQFAPPSVVVPPKDSNGSNSARKTHIEVCVRLRPLTISKESSNSFFEKKQQSSSLRLPRKPQIPRGPSTTMAATTSRLVSPSIAKRISSLTAGKDSSSSSPPDSQSSNNSNNTIYAWNVLSAETACQNPATDIVAGRTCQYTVDHVYGPETSTSELYQNSVQGLVRAAMEGYHTAVLAYGQTSTGKTHTMSGTATAPGLIPLAIRECFNYVRQLDDDEETGREYLLRISYLEVYKEHIRDLLVPNTVTTPIRLFDSSDGLVIKGLREEVVACPEQVFSLLAQGEARRQVGATHMNAHSSRSHVMVRLWIESKNMSNASGVRVSSLSLVDLAGSESVKLSGSSERREEGHYINKSLMTLGQVVYALSEAAATDNADIAKKHIPYRDSKLTRLLQPSLSGNAQVVLICCISPLVTHIEESHNTFKFAIRAKKIPQKAVISEANDEKTLLQSYREEIEDLKQQLKEAREQQDRLMQTTSLHSNASTTVSDVDDEIDQLVQSIQNMEKLILKSKPTVLSPTQRPEDLLDASDHDDDDDEDDENLLALVNVQSGYLTPAKNHNSKAAAPRSLQKDVELQTELSRIQGLLGSVLKKRMNGGSRHGPSLQPQSSNASDEEDEVRTLRAQLQEQQVATSLRKADSSFLQAQLEAKDNLLQEVSKVLEAVEKRQNELEMENAALKEEVAQLKKAAGISARLEF